MFLIALMMNISWFQVVWADLSDGVVAYYPFNNNANDESGNGNHGTVQGATLAEDRFGNTNSAYYFGGDNDKITASDAAVFQFGTYDQYLGKNNSNRHLETNSYQTSSYWQ